jgi:hypothetical protein
MAAAEHVWKGDIGMKNALIRGMGFLVAMFGLGLVLWAFSSTYFEAKGESDSQELQEYRSRLQEYDRDNLHSIVGGGGSSEMTPSEARALRAKIKKLESERAGSQVKWLGIKLGLAAVVFIVGCVMASHQSSSEKAHELAKKRTKAEEKAMRRIARARADAIRQDAQATAAATRRLAGRTESSANSGAGGGGSANSDFNEVECSICHRKCGGRWQKYTHRCTKCGFNYCVDCWRKAGKKCPRCGGKCERVAGGWGL